MRAEFQPVVQVIDNFVRNHRLGNVLEARVGTGKLLICSIDLTTRPDARPAARQLLHSLYRYMVSEAFVPRQSLSFDDLDRLFAGRLAALANVAAVKADSAQRGHEPLLAFDGDPTTIWHTQWNGNGARSGFPHELAVEFVKPVRIRGIVVHPRQDRNQNGWIKGYAVYVSSDGKRWGDPVVTGAFPCSGDSKRVEFGKTVTVRHLKLVALSNFSTGNQYASVAEVELIE